MITDTRDKEASQKIKKEQINLFLLSSHLSKACEIGDIDKVLDIISSKKLDLNDFLLQKLFNNSCSHGHLELVQYFLTDPYINSLHQTRKYITTGLAFACSHGHLPIVRYLLTDPEVKLLPSPSLIIQKPFVYFKNKYQSFLQTDNIDLKECNGVLFDAALHGHLHVVQYLLTSPELKQHACFDDPKYHSYFGLMAKNGYKEIIEFFLTSSVLSSRLDVHLNDDDIFKEALKHSENLLHYLILDYKIQQTPTIQEAIKTYSHIQELFEKRDFYYTLEQQISDSSHSSLRHKI